jgi:hypothetical protein
MFVSRWNVNFGGGGASKEPMLERDAAPIDAVSMSKILKKCCEIKSETSEAALINTPHVKNVSAHQPLHLPESSFKDSLEKQGAKSEKMDEFAKFWFADLKIVVSDTFCQFTSFLEISQYQPPLV